MISVFLSLELTSHLCFLVTKFLDTSCFCLSITRGPLSSVFVTKVLDKSCFCLSITQAHLSSVLPCNKVFRYELLLFVSHSRSHFSSVLPCNKVLSSELYLPVDHSKSPLICSSVYLSISQGPLSSIPLSTCRSVKDPSHLFLCLFVDQLKTPLICSSFCMSISQTDTRVLCTKSFLHGRSPRPPKGLLSTAVSTGHN